MLRHVMEIAAVLAAVGAIGLHLAAAPAAEDKANPAEAPAKLKAVVIIGGHGFDKKTFPLPFQGHDDLACEIREAKVKGQPSLFEDISKFPYDVIVLYNFGQKITSAEQANFLKLLDKGVGLVILHHAIAAYPDWDEFEKVLLGAKYCLKPFERDGVQYVRSVWKEGVDMNIHVEDPDHPITKGLKDFVIHDETYGKWTYHGGSHLLLTTDHPLANKQIAWVRMAGKARVFFMQLGHGAEAHTHKAFRQLVSQAIRWSAGRLPLGIPEASARKDKKQ